MDSYYAWQEIKCFDRLESAQTLVDQVKSK